MQMPKGVFTALLVLGWAVIAMPVHAAVTIEPEETGEFVSDRNFAGTLVLTYPNRDIAIVEPSDDIPEIPSGSIMEIFDGHIQVATEEGDSVKVSILGFEFSLGNGSVVTAVANETDGKIIVRSGFATITDDQGNVVTIKAPQVFPVTLGKLIEALPTADTEQTGFDTTADPSPDSTSIDAPTPSAPPPATASI